VGPLGCIIPKDKPHVLASPLSATPGGAPTDVPVVVGFNWYTSFDTPKEIEGTFHLPDVAKGEDLGSIRGGHCFCFEPMYSVVLDRRPAQVFYNQGQEGACVGFGNSRAITIHKAAHPMATPTVEQVEAGARAAFFQDDLGGHIKGKWTFDTIPEGGRENYREMVRAVLGAALAAGEVEFFDAFWLYDEARRLEGTYPSGEGASVKAGAEVLLEKGHRLQTGQQVCTRDAGDAAPSLIDGIKTIRWATTVEEVLAALARPGAQAIPFENSWGLAYPSAETSVVWMPVATFAQLLAEGGEAGVYVEA